MTPEQRAARERKQKIFVAVGGVVLLALLAIQLPKILGGSSPSEAAPPTTTEAPSTASDSPPSATAAALGGTSLPPAVEGAKLRSFSVFARKDPFVQQVVTPTEAPSGGPSGAGTEEKAAPKGAEKPATAKFTSGGTATDSVTVIRVNGSPEALEQGTTFPATDPVFVLIAESPKRRSVTVGIAGGSFANGAKAIALKVGKPLVLENTATGAKYKLVLVSVGDGSRPSAEQPAHEPPAPPESP